MPDAYCRACNAAFTKPLPAPYGGICPHCVARGDIVTLTDVPTRRITGQRSRGDTPHHARPDGTQRPVER
jgi:hypothetical protein